MDILIQNYFDKFLKILFINDFILLKLKITMEYAVKTWFHL